MQQYSGLQISIPSRFGLICIYPHGDSASMESCEVDSGATSWSIDCHGDPMASDLISRLPAFQNVTDPLLNSLIGFKF